MININYIWDKKLALQSACDIYEYELKNSNKKFIGWFFIALAQFGVVGALKHDAYGFLVVATVGLVYWYGLRWSLRKYFINKTFNKSPLANKQISLIAKDDGVYLDDKIQFNFDNIKKVAFLDNATVIYHNIGTFYIPNNAFDLAKDRDKYHKLITKESS
jgi:hypothetical protein